MTTRNNGPTGPKIALVLAIALAVFALAFLASCGGTPPEPPPEPPPCECELEPDPEPAQIVVPSPAEWLTICLTVRDGRVRRAAYFILQGHNEWREANGLEPLPIGDCELGDDKTVKPTS